jgi:LysR family glycine cleavage system transcriptional activator
MSHRRISLRAVETFVVAARGLSLTAAGEKLGLSTPAVSRRISDLEAELGVRLFRRFNRRIELTEAGSQYLAAAGAAVDSIHEVTDAVRQNGGQTGIKISTIPALASSWLMPRLAAFRLERPDIEIELQTTTDLIDFSTSDIHAAIRFGEGQWPNLESDKLLDINVTPVCAPGLMPVIGKVSAAELDRFTILSITQAMGVWEDWFEAVGLEGYQPKHLKTFDSVAVLYEAASSGMGLALGATYLVDSYVNSGRLTNAFDVTPMATTGSYHLVYRFRDRNWAPLRALRRALLTSSSARAADEMLG